MAYFSFIGWFQVLNFWSVDFFSCESCFKKSRYLILQIQTWIQRFWQSRLYAKCIRPSYTWSLTWLQELYEVGFSEGFDPYCEKGGVIPFYGWGS